MSFLGLAWVSMIATAAISAGLAAPRREIPTIGLMRPLPPGARGC